MRWWPVFLLFLVSCAEDDDSLSETRATNLQTAVVSILQQHCYECHSDDSTVDTEFKSANIIDLMISQGYMVEDDAEGSPLFIRVTADDDTIMPPSPAEPLSEEDIDFLREYIDTLDGE